MGASESKRSGQVISKSPPPQPVEPPYPGPAAEYNFINVGVTMSTNITLGFNQTSIMTSNVDAYYGLLSQPYAQGFRLLSFYHVPGQAQRVGGLFSRSVMMPFQGIFCRYPSVPISENYQLRIEKSVIQPQIVWNGFITTRSDVITDIQHLFQTIANNTQNGGRLICIELTGQQQQTHSGLGMNQRMPIMGCDLFFEIPLGDSQENYTYNVVSAPMMITISPGLRPTPKVQCDWVGILAQQLSQGWKLVEIFMDQTQSSQTHGFSAHSQVNTQWFFEKPASRMNDLNPRYQGTVVEHEILISHSGLSGTTTTANWESRIQEMGRNGWELACILETPEFRFAGLTSMYMKVLLFFQRKMISPPMGTCPQLHPTDPSDPPPAYDYNM